MFHYFFDRNRNIKKNQKLKEKFQETKCHDVIQSKTCNSFTNHILYYDQQQQSVYMILVLR